jgi:hypothetical protein
LEETFTPLKRGQEAHDRVICLCIPGAVQAGLRLIDVSIPRASFIQMKRTILLRVDLPVRN